MVGSDVLSFVGLWDLYFRVVNNSRFVSGFRVSGLYLPLWPPSQTWHRFDESMLGRYGGLQGVSGFRLGAGR